LDNLFPVMLNLKKRRVLIVGGGTVAARKLAALALAGADIFVVSTSFSEELISVALSVSAQLCQAEYSIAALDGCSLCFACTSSQETNERVAADCRRQGVFFSRVDDQAEMDFILPACLRRGDLTVAVSTGGASPALAKSIRERLEIIFPSQWEEGLVLLGEARQLIKARCADEALRRILLQNLGGETATTLLWENNLPALKAWIAEQVEQAVSF
jgi:siroheme synthase-like protein